MGNKLEDRIKNIMSVVLEIPAKEIDDGSSPDTIESLDSLKHMNLVIALEEELDTEYIEDEILDMMNYALRRSSIMEK